MAGAIYPDGAFTSVTICNPGTTTCQTIDGILVDTGSFGLRILSSAITLTGLQTLTSGSSTLYNCINFADGSYLWGTAAVADVEMAGEKASSETIQVIADPTPGPLPSPPIVQTAIDEDNQAADWAPMASSESDLNRWIVDRLAIPTSAMVLLRSRSIIFALAVRPVHPHPCVVDSGASSQQVTNPVALFATDNNGTIVELPALTGAAATESGSLIFGIGTQTNNQVPASASIFTLDQFDTFSVTYKGVTYNSTTVPPTPSFIDLGSNGLFFPDATITVCADVTVLLLPSQSAESFCHQHGDNQGNRRNQHG